MTWIDWIIVIVPMAFVVGLAFHSKRYSRNAVDYLAAGRVARRYVISVGDLAAGLSVITLVAGAEQYYQTGFGIGFWGYIVTPIGIVLSLFGFCTYRWRETRSLSKGQFIENRYGSKAFRVVTAAISTIAEAVTNAIGPAIAANFFIYYLGLPHRVMIFGIGLPCYGIVVFLCLTLAMAIIWPGGRISLLVTDSVQALLSYPIFVIFVGFILLKFSYDVDISPILWDRAPNESFINPYDIAKLRDFNMFALIVSVTSTVMNRASWIGNDTTNSGLTPHEQKMANILGSWRNGFAYIMIMLLGVITVVFMNHGNFADSSRFGISNNDVRQQLAAQVLDGVVQNPVEREKIMTSVAALPPVKHEIGKDPKLSQSQNLETRYFDVVRKELGDSPEGRFQFQQFRTLYQQQMMPVVASKIFPVGLFGLFCLLMVMLLISTDDTRIFNATGCIVQDMILPFWKKQISPKHHILLLRLTALGVTLFFLVVALFFSQMDYINMFTTIMCAFWLGGAGPIMVFGLYTRFGNLTGAWCSLIFGSGTSLLGLIFQRNWAQSIYPALERWGYVENLDNILIAASKPFNPWIVWRMDAVKFPINSFEIFFISMILAIGTYIIGSYLTYKPYDLDKLLHRGKYRDEEDEVLAPVKWTLKSFFFSKLISITPEYTRGDKAIAWSVFIYSIFYQFIGCFLVVVIWNFFSPWPREWWNWYFYLTFIVIPGIIGIISTVWFVTGGIIDTKRLFHDLEARIADDSDNGQIQLSKDQTAKDKNK